MNNTDLHYGGTHRRLALFESRKKAVLVDTKTLTASIVPSNSGGGKYSTETPSDPIWEEIAQAALLTELVPSLISKKDAAKRTYTVPKRVSETASFTHSQNLSPTASLVASMLSSGEQIRCEDVLWLSRFFSSNEGRKDSTYNAWGGVEGERWATSLAARLSYDSALNDDGHFETPGIQAFVEPNNSFYALLDDAPPRGRHATTLYRLTPHESLQAWGNGDWFECDDPSEYDSYKIVELDEDAALYVAGSLFDAPEVPVDIHAPNPEAYELAVKAYDEIDWTIIDRMLPEGIVAAGVPEEDYSPEERKEDAAQQLRDANGRFITDGAMGVIKSTQTPGKIVSQSPETGMVTVEVSNGQNVEAQAMDFEVGASVEAKADPEVAKREAPDMSGIFSEPKPEPEPKMILPYDPDLMSAKDINEEIDGYEKEIIETRQEKAKDFEKLTEEDSEVVTAALEDEVLPESLQTESDSNPESTDVEPLYLAIVDKDDPRSVMEFVALVPISATSSEAKTFRRVGGKWVEDPDILRDLRSATPPPIVKISKEEALDVLAQVDNVKVADPDRDVTQPEEPAATAPEEPVVTAAGPPKGGSAESLRRYWSTGGVGGAKIGWAAPGNGDFNRCVKLLSKYLGARSSGYCAKLHRRNTGVWPGDKRNTGKMSIQASGMVQSPQAIIASAKSYAKLESIRRRVYDPTYVSVPEYPTEINGERCGRPFIIPCVVPEGLHTGDKRYFGKGSIGIRNLPLPLLWQIKTAPGHDGAVIVGRIDRVERTDFGLGNAIGVFDTGPYGAEAQRLVEAMMLNWVSADMDKFEMNEGLSTEDTVFINKSRLMGITLVAKPAFQECKIQLL